MQLILAGKTPRDGANYSCGWRGCEYSAPVMNIVTWEVFEKLTRFNMDTRAICAYHEQIAARIILEEIE